MNSALGGRLRQLGIELPPPFQPVATYVGAVVVGDQIWVSGMGPTWDKEIRYRGKLGRDLTLEEGQQAARLTALNLLAHAVAAAGGADRVGPCLKLFGLVHSAPGFTDQHLVLNGASDLLGALFPGSPHARAAVAAPALPFSIAVELDGVFRLLP
ncbi:MAG: RidA family protein [Alphaproteobacteria bacterium]|nr:RidA family protein [Alphaproteobacteria bacterium]